jgi:hypothetical protein
VLFSWQSGTSSCSSKVLALALASDNKVLASTCSRSSRVLALALILIPKSLTPSFFRRFTALQECFFPFAELLPIRKSRFVRRFTVLRGYCFSELYKS